MLYVLSYYTQGRFLGGLQPDTEPGTAYAVMPQLILLCAPCNQLFCIGCYDLAYKNVSLVEHSKCLATPLAATLIFYLLSNKKD